MFCGCTPAAHLPPPAGSVSKVKMALGWDPGTFNKTQFFRVLAGNRPAAVSRNLVAEVTFSIGWKYHDEYR